MTQSDELPNERARHLLKVLVERYIRDGAPVGSRTLSRDSGLELSAATVRNVMSDLEELGFVASPHTSAGRVPTDKGFRFFVDTLLTVQPPKSRDVERLKKSLDESAESSKALATATSQLLSTVTRLAGVVTVPRQEHAALRQIEFVGISDNRVLAILVESSGDVHNRILHVERNFSDALLRQAANYLNEQFGGKELGEVRSQLLDELQATRMHVNRMMLDAIQMAQRVFVEESGGERDFVMAGETNLMEFAELSDVEKLRQLFEAFNEKHDILHLLDLSLESEGVQIFIGHESGYDILDECSLVTAPYRIDEEVVGVLGVIGPTRMPYERVIPIVDVTARLLGSALNSRG